MTVFPHLSWFINEDGWPYLYRRDRQNRDFPGDFRQAYDTCAEACEAAGVDLEDFIRQR